MRIISDRYLLAAVRMYEYCEYVKRRPGSSVSVRVGAGVEAGVPGRRTGGRGSRRSGCWRWRLLHGGRGGGRIRRPDVVVHHVAVAVDVSVVVIILHVQQRLGDVLVRHVGRRRSPPPSPPPPGVGGVGRGLARPRPAHDLHAVVDVVRDADVLQLPVPGPGHRHVISLPEVDVQVVESDGRVWPPRPGAPPTSTSLGLPKNVQPADGHNQGKNNDDKCH